MTDITRDEWLRALGREAEPGDPDALSARELANMLGVTYRQAANYGERLVAQGKAIRTFKRVDRRKTGTGGRSEVIAYKLLKPEPTKKRK